MSEYGQYIVLADGGLDDPETKAMALKALLENYKHTTAVLGVPLEAPEILEHRHQPRYKPTRKTLEESGFPADEIDEYLTWAETVEWPIYRDMIAWRAASKP